MFWDKFSLFMPILILIGISLWNMYYVSQTIKMYQNYFFKQALWFLLGFGVFFIFRLLKPDFFFRLSGALYWINVLLLILVLFFGTTINGSRAWFRLPFFSFSPGRDTA